MACVGYTFPFLPVHTGAVLQRKTYTPREQKLTHCGSSVLSATTTSSPAMSSTRFSLRRGHSPALFPKYKDTIEVCFIDDLDEEVWWEAVVLTKERMFKRKDCTIVYLAQHGEDAGICAVRFVDENMLCNVLPDGSRGDKSKWRVVLTEEGCRDRGDCTPPPPRENTSPPAPVAAVSRTQATSSVQVVQLQKRVGLVEEDVSFIRRQRSGPDAVSLSNEIRVETKLGVIAALRRSMSQGLASREDGPDHDGVMQEGTVRWRYRCTMERFKTFVTAVHDRFRRNADRNHSDDGKDVPVHFIPKYDRLNDDAGFGTAEVRFRTAVQLFGFLGQMKESDLMGIIWQKHSTGSHLRVIGTLQNCKRDGADDTDEADDQENDDRGTLLRVFLGHSSTSSVNDSAGFVAGNTSEEAPGEYAACIEFDDKHWDADNNCFASSAMIQKRETACDMHSNTEGSWYRIKWQVEGVRSQRTYGDVTLDREGVRLGTMVVEIPFVVFGQELVRDISELCTPEDLLAVIQSTA